MYRLQQTNIVPQCVIVYIIIMIMYVYYGYIGRMENRWSPLSAVLIDWRTEVKTYDVWASRFHIYASRSVRSELAE